MSIEQSTALEIILQSVKQAQGAAEAALSAAESALKTERRISQRLDIHEAQTAHSQLMRELEDELAQSGGTA